MKAARTVRSDADSLGDLVAALARIELRQTVHEQVARRVVDMLAIHNEKLDAILEAATREPGPSPVLGVLAEILESLRAAGKPAGGLARAHWPRPSATNGRASRTWMMNRTRRIRRWSRPGRILSTTGPDERH